MLTDRQVKSLKTDRPQIDVFDGDLRALASALPTKPEELLPVLPPPAPGGLRLPAPAGHSWDYPHLPLAEARERARALLREVETGKDPSTGLARQYVRRRSKNRQGAVAADPRLHKLFPEGFLPGTFGELAALYMERHVWVNLKSPRHHEEALRRDLLPR